jgi:hypothetical protein
MIDPERAHLLERIAELETRLRRWQRTCYLLLAILGLPVAVGGLFGAVWGPPFLRERATLEERLKQSESRVHRAVDRAIAAEAEAERQKALAEQARRQATERGGKDRE